MRKQKYIVVLTYKDGSKRTRDFASARAAASYMDRLMDRDPNIREGEVR